MTMTYVFTITKSNTTMGKTKITRKRWNASDSRILTTLAKKGKNNFEIAKVLNRTPIAIYERRRKLGLSLGEFPGSTATEKMVSYTATKILWGTL